MSNQAQWFDWLFLGLFIVGWFLALFKGETFLRLPERTRVLIAAGFMMPMLLWLIIRHA